MDFAGAVEAVERGGINAHTHLYSGLAPLGMPEPVPAPQNFPEILERVWWPLDRALDEETLRASARFYVADALLKGTTTLIDHHESPNLIEGSLDILADACEELGMRALLCYGATERNGGRDEARAGLEECRRFLIENRRPLVAGAVGLHASFTVSDETIREAGAMCRELGAVLHVHVAEDICDVEDAKRRGYAGPLERFVELDAAVRGSILAHGVHLHGQQVRSSAERGLWLVQNPRSNRANGVGYPRNLSESWKVALGTDGYPADMGDEAQTLYLDAVMAGEDRTGVEDRVTAGARLVDERFGLGTSLADEVVVENGRLVAVTVNGRMVVEDARLVFADEAEIREEAVRAASVLFKRMERL